VRTKTAENPNVEEEFRCPHGVTVARRFRGGSYAGRPAEDACTACAVKAIFGFWTWRSR
jgi:hypothetical protein